MHQFDSDQDFELIILVSQLFYFPVQYPLWELVYQLGFEDEKDATEFFSHYGLSASNGQLGLDKNRFYDPESAYTVKRSPVLVGGKQTTSLGEVGNLLSRPLFRIVDIVYFSSTGFDSWSMANYYQK